MSSSLSRHLGNHFPVVQHSVAGRLLNGARSSVRENHFLQSFDICVFGIAAIDQKGQSDRETQLVDVAHHSACEQFYFRCRSHE
jgi:hypothetical protein